MMRAAPLLLTVGLAVGLALSGSALAQDGEEELPEDPFANDTDPFAESDDPLANETDPFEAYDEAARAAENVSLEEPVDSGDDESDGDASDEPPAPADDPEDDRSVPGPGLLAALAATALALLATRRR